MTGEVLQLRDFDRRPAVATPRDEPAEVIILPVVRVERAVKAIGADVLRRHVRHSLLGDPA